MDPAGLDLIREALSNQGVLMGRHDQMLREVMDNLASLVANVAQMGHHLNLVSTHLAPPAPEDPAPPQELASVPAQPALPSLKGPAEVGHRYKKVLKTFGRVRTMSEAFRIYNVDRGTIKMTAPIAELKILDPDTFENLKFDPAIDTLLSFAKKCATNVTPDKKAKIEDMKAKGKLLPLLMKY
ncbi:hypothetical protein NQZ68_012561 [Dissostichus eleginoides]|nr:hypothetical protein NQZ68_012561 [Dissostichus eleginoides]